MTTFFAETEMRHEGGSGTSAEAAVARAGELDWKGITDELNAQGSAVLGLQGSFFAADSEESIFVALVMGTVSLPTLRESAKGGAPERYPKLEDAPEPGLLEKVYFAPRPRA